MTKNFTELHVGGVYLREDGEVKLIVDSTIGRYCFESHDEDDYTENGEFLEGRDTGKDLVHYLCDIDVLKRLPEIMAENERLKAIFNGIDNPESWVKDSKVIRMKLIALEEINRENAIHGQSHMEECHNEIIKLKAERDELLAALKFCSSVIRHTGMFERSEQIAVDMANKAIAKTEADDSITKRS